MRACSLTRSWTRTSNRCASCRTRSRYSATSSANPAARSPAQNHCNRPGSIICSEVVLHTELDQPRVERGSRRQPVRTIGAVDPEDGAAVQQVVDVEVELVLAVRRPEDLA